MDQLNVAHSYVQIRMLCRICTCTIWGDYDRNLLLEYSMSAIITKGTLLFKDIHGLIILLQSVSWTYMLNFGMTFLMPYLWWRINLFCGWLNSLMEGISVNQRPFWTRYIRVFCSVINREYNTMSMRADTSEENDSKTRIICYLFDAPLVDVFLNHWSVIHI